MITKEEAAARLDGGEYRKEGSRELFAEMKAAGLVAVFGASDDLMEFRGAIDEELGAFDGTTAYVSQHGVSVKSGDGREAIKAIWDEGEFPWRYETSIPRVEFSIFEDGEPYCRGIVFALADVPAPSSAIGR